MESLYFGKYNNLIMAFFNIKQCVHFFIDYLGDIKLICKIKNEFFLLKCLKIEILNLNHCKVPFNTKNNPLHR